MMIIYIYKNLFKLKNKIRKKIIIVNIKNIIINDLYILVGNFLHLQQEKYQ